MHCSRVDAFRHRAAFTIADCNAASHVYPALTLTRAGSPGRDRGSQNEWRAMNVIRHGLCPIFEGALDAVNPLALSLATISASL
jgi:hypothetical protein